MNTKKFFTDLSNDDLLMEYNRTYNLFSSICKNTDKLEQALDAIEKLDVTNEDFNTLELTLSHMLSYRSLISLKLDDIQAEMRSRYIEAHPDIETMLWEPMFFLSHGTVLQWFDESFKNVIYRDGVQL